MRERLEAIYAGERARLLAQEKDALRAGEYARPVFGEGPLEPRLMLMGEAPGAEEARLGRPFMGKAGKQLDALLAKAGIERADAFVTNAVKFRPARITARGMANRTPAPEELRASLPLLLEELALVRPRLIAPLGNTPLRALYLLAGLAPKSVGDVHGRLVRLLIGGTEYPVFPLYHPASVIYNRALMPVLENDLEQLHRALGEGKENFS